MFARCLITSYLSPYLLYIYVVLLICLFCLSRSSSQKHKHTYMSYIHLHVLCTYIRPHNPLDSMRISGKDVTLDPSPLSPPVVNPPPLAFNPRLALCKCRPKCIDKPALTPCLCFVALPLPSPSHPSPHSFPSLSFPLVPSTSLPPSLFPTLLHSQSSYPVTARRQRRRRRRRVRWQDRVQKSENGNEKSVGKCSGDEFARWRRWYLWLGWW